MYILRWLCNIIYLHCGGSRNCQTELPDLKMMSTTTKQRSTLTVVRWSETPRNHVGPPEHSNPVVRWTTEIFSSKQNRNMAKKSKQSSPLAADNTRNTVPLSPLFTNKTSVNNHAGHELLRSRLTIRSRPFYGTKDVFIIMRDMNYWGRDRPSTQLT